MDLIQLIGVPVRYYLRGAIYFASPSDGFSGGQALAFGYFPDHVVA